jgi:hypothetical protein
MGQQSARAHLTNGRVTDENFDVEMQTGNRGAEAISSENCWEKRKMIH